MYLGGGARFTKEAAWQEKEVKGGKGRKGVGWIGGPLPTTIS